MTQSLNIGAAVGGVALAIGVAFAGMELGGSLIEMRRADRVVTVKGLSETEVQADVVNWRIPFRGEGDDAPAALAVVSEAEATIAGFLRKGGVAEADIIKEPPGLRIERYYVESSSGGQVERNRFVATSGVRVRSREVDLVAELAGKTGALLDAGVLLGDNDYAEPVKPEYLFTGLNEIKPEILRKATEAARASAAQFAEDSGAAVGDIASADQGVIRILPRDGQFDERFERDKIVRVVSTIRYYLNDD